MTTCTSCGNNEGVKTLTINKSDHLTEDEQEHYLTEKDVHFDVNFAGNDSVASRLVCPVCYSDAKN